MLKRSTAVAFFCLSLPVASWSQGIPIEPGMWQTTTEMTMSFMAQGQTRTEQECVTDTEFNAEMLAKDNDCDVQDYSVSGNTLSFTMVCPGPEGPTTGEGMYVSHGDSGSGEMNMTMMMSGAQQSMQMKWTGERIGAC